MKQYHLCLDCVKTETGRPAGELPVPVFNAVRDKMAFMGDGTICPVCGGTNISKIFGIGTSYIRGYGFADKKGVRNDMDLHTMATGNDPYKEHRQLGESSDVIHRLQKRKEHDTHPKTIHLGG